jgi:hypothetical protein
MQVVAAKVQGVGVDSQEQMEMVTEALRDTESALENALLRHETDDEEKRGAWERAEMAEGEMEGLERTVEEQALRLVEQVWTYIHTHTNTH